MSMRDRMAEYTANLFGQTEEEPEPEPSEAGIKFTEEGDAVPALSREEEMGQIVEAQKEEKEPEPQAEGPEEPSGSDEISGLRNELVNLRRERRQQAQYMDNLQRTIEEIRQEAEREDAEEADVAPDPEEDWVGHVEYTLQKMLSSKLDPYLSALESMRAQAEVSEEVQAVQNLAAHANQLEQAFRQTHADYDQAYVAWLTPYYEDFQEMGMTDQQIAAALQQLQAQFLAAQFNEGKNPVETVYRLGKRRVGQAASPAAPTQRTKEAAAERVRKGVQSLSQVPGSPRDPVAQDGFITPNRFWNDVPASMRLELLQDEEFAEAMLRGGDEPVRVPTRVPPKRF